MVGTKITYYTIIARSPDEIGTTKQSYGCLLI
jgi:hypothetical protein